MHPEHNKLPDWNRYQWGWAFARHNPDIIKIWERWNGKINNFPFNNPKLAWRIKEFRPLLQQLQKYHIAYPVNPNTAPEDASIDMWRIDALPISLSTPGRVDQMYDYHGIVCAINKNEPWPNWNSRYVSLQFDLDRDIDKQCEEAKNILKKICPDPKIEKKPTGEAPKPVRLWDSLRSWELRQEGYLDSKISKILGFDLRGSENDLAYVDQRARAAEAYMKKDGHLKILKYMKN